MCTLLLRCSPSTREPSLPQLLPLNGPMTSSTDTSNDFAKHLSLVYLESQFQNAFFVLVISGLFALKSVVVTFSSTAIPEAATSDQKEIKRTAKLLDFRREKTL